ncbi:hypothetical protein [Halomonas sp.]|uniref:hypothetical protein n=1 Tax=Halomonas sp. TaxID=1486246 RepID=UPI00298EB444|nr:hypothetical protein [Halomonas sp.]MDW7748040.1 hypothetical protein [Halomonas sp.]
MKVRHSPALRRRLMAGLLPLALTVPAGLAQAEAFTQAPSAPRLLAQHSDHTDSHADGEHGSGGKQGGGQGQRKRLGKGAGTGEARGGHTAESDIFRDEGFDRGNSERGGGPPEGRGEHEDGDDHEDGEEGGGHEDGEEHDHEA